MLTYKEIKERYGLSRQTVDRAVASGQLEKHTFAGGKKIFFQEEDIQKLFEPKK